jgi:23S rRNA U2552 (ribose-2'-O)-methylase RlmE/FtsJ
MSLLDTSDKVFWHNYLGFYENFFQGRDFLNVAEIGVFKGNSIRWLLERFPSASIHGADILPIQPEWPVSDRFTFTQLDQGDVKQLRTFFSKHPFDLIIEDGSHIPTHQALCLIEGVQALTRGGLYVLEDIHTSHPSYQKAKSRFPFSKKERNGNALSVLLAIDHYKRLSTKIDSEKARAIAKDSMFEDSDVLFLASNISHISLYKRTNLPDYCYSCGSGDFDFSAYKCRCGVDVFSDSDSMTFVVEKA